MRCRAQTKAGRRCARQASRGADRCQAHAGSAVGRPSKLTEELERKLCDALRAGNYLEVAARYAGVARATVHRWLAAAAEDGADPRLVRFREAVRKAEADAEVHSVGILRRAAGQGDWRAALAHLERRYPERWRRRDHSPARDPAGEPTGAELDTTDPDTRALLSALLKRRQADR